MEKATYEKNQKAWMDIQASGTTRPSASGMAANSASPGALPFGLTDPFAPGNMPPGLQRLTSPDPATRIGAVMGTGIGGVSNPATIASSMTNRILATVMGTQLLTSAIAGFMSGPNTEIGKAFNRFWAEQGVDVGNLRLNAEEQMFTMPVEDPATGQWRYLHNDEKALRKRMADAGITPDLQDARMIQLSQIRDANLQLVNSIGLSPEQIRQQTPAGTLPFAGAQQLAKQQFEQRQTEEKQTASEKERMATGAKSISPISQQIAEQAGGTIVRNQAGQLISVDAAGNKTVVHAPGLVTAPNDPAKTQADLEAVRAEQARKKINVEGQGGFSVAPDKKEAVDTLARGTQPELASSLFPGGFS